MYKNKLGLIKLYMYLCLYAICLQIDFIKIDWINAIQEKEVD